MQSDLRIKSFVSSFAEENAYVVYDAHKNGIVIDPGVYAEEEKKALFSFIKEEGIRIERLLLTHAHIDHIISVQESCAQWNIAPFLHENEKTLFARSTDDAAMFQLDYKPYKGEIHWLGNAHKTIAVSWGEISILHTPGHSPGSVCYYFPQEHFLIGGDVLFLQSIGRTDLPGGNFDELIHSIRDKLFSLDNGTKVYPGHGPATYIGYEKEHNPFLK